jgi:hypothetical protein
LKVQAASVKWDWHLAQTRTLALLKEAFPSIHRHTEWNHWYYYSEKAVLCVKIIWSLFSGSTVSNYIRKAEKYLFPGTLPPLLSYSLRLYIVVWILLVPLRSRLLPHKKSRVCVEIRAFNPQSQSRAAFMIGQGFLPDVIPRVADELVFRLSKNRPVIPAVASWMGPFELSKSTTLKN